MIVVMTLLAIPPTRRRTRPLAFALIWCALTAPLSLLASSWQQARGWPDGDVLQLVMLAPGVAAAMTWLAFRHWLPSDQAPVGVPAFCRQLAAGFGWVLACYATLALLNGRLGSLPASVAGTPIAVVVVLQVLGALGEETGYRGVLLTAFLRRFPAGTAAVLNGIFFGVIHIGYWSLGPLQVGVFVLSTVGLVVAMTALYRGSFWQRMCVTTTMHAGANLAIFAIGDDARLWQVAAAMWVGTACVWVGRRWIAPCADGTDTP
jgi:membrane protease YdiL (CAAX protease family)